MSNEKQVDPGRRGLLVATGAAGGVVGLATAGALVSTFQPSERAKAAGAPVEVDISALKPGEQMTVEWRGKPELLVAIGICTHLGCSPSSKFSPGPQPSLPDDWEGGFLCPCHGSTFDMAGRVFKNKPAPDNLVVPRYMFLSDTKLVIGKDEKGEA